MITQRHGAHLDRVFNSLESDAGNFCTSSCASDWTPEEKAILNQQKFGFLKTTQKALEKVPYDFKYRFRCAESRHYRAEMSFHNFARIFLGFPGPIWEPL
jgi:hypothetical protein